MKCKPSAPGIQEKSTIFFPDHQNFPDALIFDPAMLLVNVEDVYIGKRLLVLDIATDQAVVSLDSSL